MASPDPPCAIILWFMPWYQAYRSLGEPPCIPFQSNSLHPIYFGKIIGDEPIVLLFFFLNVLSGSENECHPSRERVSGCLKQAGTEAKKWMGGGRGSKPPDGDQQRGKVAKFGPSPFPIGLHYLSQNKDFSQPTKLTLNQFYTIWYISKLLVLRDRQMDDLKT